jgi:hypothetical protein
MPAQQHREIDVPFFGYLPAAVLEHANGHWRIGARDELQRRRRNVKTFELLESNVRTYCRSFPTVFMRARGHLLEDRNGREYIDFFSGAGSLSHGPLVGVAVAAG